MHNFTYKTGELKTSVATPFVRVFLVTSFSTDYEKTKDGTIFIADSEGSCTLLIEDFRCWTCKHISVTFAC